MILVDTSIWTDANPSGPPFFKERQLPSFGNEGSGEISKIRWPRKKSSESMTS